MSAIKRLYEGFGVAQDCCVSGVFPLRQNTEPGVFLGHSPVQQGQELYLAAHIAHDVARLMGYPPIEVVEHTSAALEAAEERIRELERLLQDEVHNLQFKSLETLITNQMKDIRDGQERALAAVRDAAKRTRPASAVGGAKPAGGVPGA